VIGNATCLSPPAELRGDAARAPLRISAGPRALGAGVQPETRYAWLGQDRIGYQVLGKGPPDLVMTGGVTIDVAWEDPGVALFLRSLASFSRLILFDRRGTGASDPPPPDPLPPWESYAAELTAVLDEVGSERAAVLAELDTTPAAIFFAASRPERISALILVHASAKYLASDDYPIGIPHEAAAALLAQADQLWGTDAMAAIYVPSRAGDERFRRWWAKLLRTGASPRSARALARTIMEVDLRPLLPLIQVPTLILHRRGFHIPPVEHARFLVEHVSGAKLVELPGADMSVIWDTPELALDLVEEFLTGRPAHSRPHAAAGHRLVHRHRRLDRAGHSTGGSSLAGAAGSARRTGPPGGRGVSGPAGQDNW